jgi:hypothetical protein
LKDTDFDRLSERAALLTNKGYFDRHRELVPEYGVQGAWEKLEGELPFGLTRYSSFHAFEAAKRKESEGTLNQTVYLRK